MAKWVSRDLPWAPSYAWGGLAVIPPFRSRGGLFCLFGHSLFFFLSRVVENSVNSGFFFYSLTSKTFAGTVVNNVRLGGKLIAKSGGSWALARPTSVGLRLTLPSGVTVSVSRRISTKLGKLAFSTSWGSGSSKFFFKKVKLSVRGVAKNAVDHINGGKGACGVKKLFKTYGSFSLQVGNWAFTWCSTLNFIFFAVFFFSFHDLLQSLRSLHYKLNLRFVIYVLLLCAQKLQCKQRALWWLRLTHIGVR